MIVNLFASIHFLICLIAEFTFSCSLTELLCFIISTVSSPYNLTAIFVFSGKLFIYNIVSISGPSLALWGIPHVTKHKTEQIPFTTVYCFRLIQKL